MPRSARDSFVRRYNADLANDFGNLVNRTVSMVNRYLDGDRPQPVPKTEGRLSWSWTSYLPTYQAHVEDCGLDLALGLLFGTFTSEANQLVDSEKPWELAKAWKAGDEASGDRLRGVLGDLVEACRLVALAAAPFMPGTAPKVLSQLGYPFAYGADGTGGPPILDELTWGAHRGGQARRGGHPR